jgi:excisionase family DNA binding protein
MVTAEREKALFTVEEAQDYLSVSRMTIFRLLKAGDLRRVKIGRVTRIPRASLDAFIEHQETGSYES